MEIIEGITNMNINQTVNGFRNYIGQQGGLAHLNRFAVEITAPPIMREHAQISYYNVVLNNLSFTARSANIPSKTLSTNEVTASGPEQKYPYMDVYEDLTITFLTTKGTNTDFALPERTFFEWWVSSIIEDNNMLIGFSNEYSTDVRISILSDERKKDTKLATYVFDRAYPIGLGAIEFSHDSEELMTFEVTFSYDRFKREQINPK